MLKYWIWLSCICHASDRAKREVLDYFGNPRDVFLAHESDLMSLKSLAAKDIAAFSDKRTGRAKSILDTCTDDDIEIMTLQDAAYPERLKNIDNPPMVLFVKGKMPAVDEHPAAAIVGTRRCTPYGASCARRMGYGISSAGSLVISGLAAGIDSCGAVGSLQAGGPVIGVLGCAIDDIYPKSNRQLYADVQQVGALVSEYPPGAEIRKWNFPARNRIISGLSTGVVIVEAPERSGALITASLALEQGRELFVVPANIDSNASAGSNRLISEGAAKAVINAKDVLSEFEGLFSWKLRENFDVDSQYSEGDEGDLSYVADELSPIKSNLPEQKNVDKETDKSYIDLREQLEGLSEDELAVVSKMSTAPKHIDDITLQCGLEPSRVLAAMTMLQIKGCVSEHNGKRFSLNIIKK